MINMVKTQETVTETAGIKRLNLTPVKHGYTPERHPTKKQKGSKPTHDPPKELKISVRDEATEDLSFEQSPEIKSFKEMVATLQKDTRATRFHPKISTIYWFSISIGILISPNLRK